MGNKKKQCHSCREEFSLDKFYQKKGRNNKIRWDSICKCCKKQKKKELSSKNNFEVQNKVTSVTEAQRVDVSRTNYDSKYNYNTGLKFPLSFDTPTGEVVFDGPEDWENFVECFALLSQWEQALLAGRAPNPIQYPPPGRHARTANCN